MANGSASIIAAGTVIRGRVRADSDLEVHGHVEGSIVATGTVVVAEGGLVKSDIEANTVRVAGAVAGNLRAEALIVLEATARVVGDVSAPTIGIRPGALVRGRVATGELSAPQPARAAATRGAVPALRGTAPALRGAVAGARGSAPLLHGNAPLLHGNAPGSGGRAGEIARQGSKPVQADARNAAVAAPPSRPLATVPATPAARVQAASAPDRKSSANVASGVVASPKVAEPSRPTAQARATEAAAPPAKPERRAPPPVAPALSKHSKKTARRSVRS